MAFQLALSAPNALSQLRFGTSEWINNDECNVWQIQGVWPKRKDFIYWADKVSNRQEIVALLKRVRRLYWQQRGTL
jgi:hypothetical protein